MGLTAFQINHVELVFKVISIHNYPHKENSPQSTCCKRFYHHIPNP